MIRSTVNATEKSVYSSVGREVSEICFGSLDGTVAAKTHVMTFAQYLVNYITHNNTTISPVPSNVHWDGDAINP